MGRSKPSHEFQLAKVAMPPDAVWLSDRGLWVGSELLVDHCAPRAGLAHLETMLAIAFRQRLSKGVQRSVTAAIDDLRRGDQGLANLRLAIARHSRIPDAGRWPLRLAEAKRRLADGLTANEVLGGLDFDDVQDGLAKFAPEQLRVPAGSGRESGRWTSDQSGAPAPSTIASAIVAFAPRGASLLAPSLGAETLAALSAFAAGAGFVAALGLLVVPSPNSTSSSGPLPDDSENTYSYDHDEGRLRVLGPTGSFSRPATRTAPVSSTMPTQASRSRARSTAPSFSTATPSEPRPRRQSRQRLREPTGRKTTTRTSRSSDPGPDQPGALSASARAKAYQAQISLMINPQRPLPPGLAMNLLNPPTGKIVHYDECDEQTGTMIEANGPGFNGLLSFPAGYKASPMTGSIRAIVSFRRPARATLSGISRKIKPLR